ncbi:MAG: PQQ-binding-like beta-propeller repeat protein [Verrucomicrobiales bacterium]|nr:PQQ-binding-like beta-propeller repeat protein [Verrucomicrobiales bacterium]
MKLRTILTVAATVFVLAAGTTTSPAKIWTQAASGKKIEADLVKVENGTAFLRLADGRIGEVPVASLTAEDQDYIKNFNKPVVADGWPNFRGAKLDGISPDKGLLKTWPANGPEKVWTYENAGNGYASVSVSGGKVFTIGTRESDVVVIALDEATGNELWSKKISTDDQQGYNAGWGHGPRSTPTYSEGHVYALGPKGTLACLSAEDGNVVWRRHMIDDFGGRAGGWGFSESPFIEGDKLVIGPGGQTAGLVALNKKTGEVMWKAEEVKPGKAEYATVVPADINGVHQYIRLFEKQVVGVDADSGKLLWSSPWDGATAVIPTPIVDGNRVYIGSGYGKGCKMIEIDSNFNTTDDWQNKIMKNHHGGFIKVGDHIYGFSDGAGLICQSWDDGEMVWNEKDGQFLAKGSVTVADGMIYCLNEQNGACTLGKISPDGFEKGGQFILEPQSEIRHNQGKIWSHPVVINGRLYLRDQDLIHCYNLKP